MEFEMMMTLMSENYVKWLKGLRCVGINKLLEFFK